MKCIENVCEHKDIALEAFLGIEGVFNTASFDTIKKATKGAELSLSHADGSLYTGKQEHNCIVRKGLEGI
jgi:hypothetical protein